MSLQESSSFGTAEKFLFQRKAALESALAKILVRMKVRSVEDLLAQYETQGTSHPLSSYIMLISSVLNQNSSDVQ